MAATSITVRMHPDVRRERRILPVSLASDIVKAGRIRVICSELPRLLRRQWSMHPDIESALNEVARHTRRAITEPAHFASRPWTQADDDKLRKLALTGLSSRAIGIRMNRTETAVRSRAKQLQVILRKIRLKQLQMG